MEVIKVVCTYKMWPGKPLNTKSLIIAVKKKKVPCTLTDKGEERKELKVECEL